MGGAVFVRKTTPKIDVSRGELVPYEIVVENTLGTTLADLEVIDRFPAGFRYVDGSARLDGVGGFQGACFALLCNDIGGVETHLHHRT